VRGFQRTRLAVQPSHYPLPVKWDSSSTHANAARIRMTTLLRHLVTALTFRCMPDLRPIGVFDSGIGGLTVVKALRDLLPNEDIFYLGDTARIPYGSRSLATVERYSVQMAEMLVTENAKIVVVACNSASSVALPKLKANLPVPVLDLPGTSRARLGSGIARSFRDLCAPAK